MTVASDDSDIRDIDVTAAVGLFAREKGYIPGAQAPLYYQEGSAMHALHLIADPTSSSVARRFVHRFLADNTYSPDTSDIAELLVSELVTNAVLYGGGDDVEVRVGRLDGGIIRIEVSDASSDAPVMGDGSVHKLSGRGMLIIERMAQRWGWDIIEPGKTVWLELAA